jgi:hypothetical protein
MTMDELPKTRPARIFSYEELERILQIAAKKRRPTRLSRSGAYAYVQSTGVRTNDIKILHNSGPDRVVIASVYRGADGDTVYCVPAPPPRRGKHAHKQLAAWKRCVSALTPHHPDSIPQGVETWYRIRDGESHECTSKPGVWKHFPRGTAMLSARETKESGLYAAFWSRRCTLLAFRLKKALDGLTPTEIQPYDSGTEILVCTAPTASHDGKRLVVYGSKHDDESRQYFQIDDAYAAMNSEYRGLEDHWRRWNPDFRWKSGRDSFNGIMEWVLGCIHIPGPG